MLSGSFSSNIAAWLALSCDTTSRPKRCSHTIKISLSSLFKRVYIPLSFTSQSLSDGGRAATSLAGDPNSLDCSSLDCQMHWERTLCLVELQYFSRWYLREQMGQGTTADVMRRPAIVVVSVASPRSAQQQPPLQ